MKNWVLLVTEDKAVPVIINIKGTWRCTFLDLLLDKDHVIALHFF